jgi:hypothetical protein
MNARSAGNCLAETLPPGLLSSSPRFFIEGTPDK